MKTVTNITKEQKKFRDEYLGQDIVLAPGESVTTNRPPEDLSTWKVEEQKQSKKTMESDS